MRSTRGQKAPTSSERADKQLPQGRPEPQRRLQIFSVPSGHGAGDIRTQLGPRVLLNAGLLRLLSGAGWEGQLTTVPAAGGMRSTPHAAVHAVTRRLAALAAVAVAEATPFLALGGDHSMAAGTWSGAARGLRRRGQLGLVWIDAHMDAHTPATTPSGNWHGMPLAQLLGQCVVGDTSDMPAPGAVRPAVKPEHVCLVGVRSFEPPEAKLVQRLGVRVIDMEEIARSGLTAAVQSAVDIASRGTAGFGVSLDLDAIDPEQAPGVGTPVPGGIDAAQLRSALAGLAYLPDFLGLEVVELNPALDRGGRTTRIALDLIAASLQPKPAEKTGARGQKTAIASPAPQKRPRTDTPI